MPISSYKINIRQYAYKVLTVRCATNIRDICFPSSYANYRRRGRKFPLLSKYAIPIDVVDAFEPFAQTCKVWCAVEVYV